MATYDSRHVISLVAEEDFTEAYYKFASPGENAEGVVIADGTSTVLGAIQDAAPEGQPVRVAIGGKALVRAGATVAVGDEIGSDADGFAVPATGASVGVAISGGVEGQLIEVLFQLRAAAA